MIDNNGEEMDEPNRPTIDNYGVPIDYNCHVCDESLVWMFGDWLCAFCKPSEPEEIE